MVICPLCHETLDRGAHTWRCLQGHSFDVAKQGYVNLLTVQQKHSLHPGDTKEMVLARREFLDQGFYLPIGQTLRELVCEYAPQASSVLDVGCGEGYYLSHLNHIPERYGIDISKDAVRYAAGRYKDCTWLTATASHLPFSEGSFDVLLSMFALTMAEEYARVLAPGGIFLQVLAGAQHLTALKNIIYPTLREKEKEFDPTLEGFTLLQSKQLEFDFTVNSPELVQALLSMTPHVWRISKEGAQALARQTELSDRAQVVFNLYRKN
ncbi:MAG: methyltransferase domain-containing protein [Oscillospiraceae bacterium]|nr:methyltransferase domain-containing protein [Oscillospiraceae bacterium]